MRPLQPPGLCACSAASAAQGLSAPTARCRRRAPARAYAITTPRERPLLSPLIQPSDADGEDRWQIKEFKGAVNYFPDFLHAWNKEKFMVLGGALAAGSLASLRLTQH